MAAIDPSATPEHTGTANGDTLARATLKIIYEHIDLNPSEGSDEGSDDDNYLKALLQDRDSEDEEDEDESSSDEEEKNGGPSDPSKTKKARKQAAMEQMMKALAENDSDEIDLDSTSRTNGTLSKAKKGKAKASDKDEEGSDEDDEEGLDGMEELVLCTLDPTKVSNCPSRLHVLNPLFCLRTTSNLLILQLVKISAHISKFLELIQFILLEIM